MKKIIIFVLIGIMIISIASSELNSTKEKPAFTKKLEQTKIEKENKTKLMDIYGKTFKEVKSFNSYKQHNNITIINVTIKQGNKESYARIITNTKKFKEVLK